MTKKARLEPRLLGITLSMEKHWSHTGKSADNFPATPQGEFLGCIRKSLNKLKSHLIIKNNISAYFTPFGSHISVCVVSGGWLTQTWLSWSCPAVD